MTRPQRQTPPPVTPTATIGPATEARIRAAFAGTAIISAIAACGILGCSPKTLTRLVDLGAIRAVRKGGGDRRGYTEGDIRAYLTESAAPCPSTNPQKARISNTTFNSKVVAFTDLQASKRAAPPKR